MILLYASELLQIRALIPHHGVAPDFVVFGDKRYLLEAELITTYRRINLTPEELRFNLEMSRSRICTEWGFVDVKTQFHLLSMRTRLRLHHEVFTCSQ